MHTHKLTHTNAHTKNSPGKRCAQDERENKTDGERGEQLTTWPCVSSKQGQGGGGKEQKRKKRRKTQEVTKGKKMKTTRRGKVYIFLISRIHFSTQNLRKALFSVLKSKRILVSVFKSKKHVRAWLRSNHEHSCLCLIKTPYLFKILTEEHLIKIIDNNLTSLLS